MSKAANRIYEFGEFRLETAERLLLRRGTPIPLTPKAFDTLLVLVRNSGRLVEKDDLIKQIWPDAIVEEANLARNVWTLRKALGNGSGEHDCEAVQNADAAHDVHDVRDHTPCGNLQSFDARECVGQ